MPNKKSHVKHHSLEGARVLRHGLMGNVNAAPMGKGKIPHDYEPESEAVSAPAPAPSPAPAPAQPSLLQRMASGLGSFVGNFTAPVVLVEETSSSATAPLLPKTPPHSRHTTLDSYGLPLMSEHGESDSETSNTRNKATDLNQGGLRRRSSLTKAEISDELRRQALAEPSAASAGSGRELFIDSGTPTPSGFWEKHKVSVITLSTVALIIFISLLIYFLKTHKNGSSPTPTPPGPDPEGSLALSGGINGTYPADSVAIPNRDVSLRNLVGEANTTLVITLLNTLGVCWALFQNQNRTLSLAQPAQFNAIYPDVRRFLADVQAVEFSCDNGPSRILEELTVQDTNTNQTASLSTLSQFSGLLPPLPSHYPSPSATVTPTPTSSPSNCLNFNITAPLAEKNCQANADCYLFSDLSINSFTVDGSILAEQLFSVGAALPTAADTQFYQYCQGEGKLPPNFNHTSFDSQNTICTISTNPVSGTIGFNSLLPSLGVRVNSNDEPGWVVCAGLFYQQNNCPSVLIDKAVCVKRIWEEAPKGVKLFDIEAHNKTL